MTYIVRLASAVGTALRYAWAAGKTRLLLAMFFTFALGVVPVLSAWAVKVIVDGMISAPASGAASVPRPILLGFIAYAALTLLGRLGPQLERHNNALLGRKVDLTVQLSILGKISGLPGIDHLERPEFYNDIRLVEGGASQLSRKTINIVVTVARGLMTVGGFLGILIGFSLEIALVVLLAALPQLITEVWLSRQRVKSIEDIAPLQRRAQVNSFLLSTHFAAKEVRVYALQQYLLDRYRQLVTRVHEIMHSQERRDLLWNGILDASSVILATGAFVMAVVMALYGSLSVGDVTLMVAAVGSVNGGLGSVVRAIAELDEVVYYAERLSRVMELESSLARVACPQIAPRLSSGIRLDSVSFRYSNDGPWVLRDLTFELPVGKALALVGANGSGKSTLVKLLTRLYDPTSGMLLWDDIEYKALEIESLRRRCSVVFQDFVRYDMSAFDNIAVGDLSAADVPGRVESAARQASIHEHLSSLPKGYETFLSRSIHGDDNYEVAELSGGQWQRIAIARALMREADLVILDEPSAAIDPQAEIEILEEYMRLRRGRTSVIVSHRLRTAQLADVIAVMEDGKIIEMGSHEELMARNGHYGSLVRRYARPPNKSPVLRT